MDHVLDVLMHPGIPTGAVDSFHMQRNAPFELSAAQTICCLSAEILAPKPLFALAVMTQGQECEQCRCTSQTHFLQMRAISRQGRAARLVPGQTVA